MLFNKILFLFVIILIIIIIKNLLNIKILKTNKDDIKESTIKILKTTKDKIKESATKKIYNNDNILDDYNNLKTYVIKNNLPYTDEQSIKITKNKNNNNREILFLYTYNEKLRETIDKLINEKINNKHILDFYNKHKNLKKHVYIAFATNNLKDITKIYLEHDKRIDSLEIIDEKPVVKTYNRIKIKKIDDIKQYINIFLDNNKAREIIKIMKPILDLNSLFYARYINNKIDRFDIKIGLPGYEIKDILKKLAILFNKDGFKLKEIDNYLFNVIGISNKNNQPAITFYYIYKNVNSMKTKKYFDEFMKNYKDQFKCTCKDCE